MSYNNDEQARRAQAARDAQWASNSRQPQNPNTYQAGTFSNPDEPIIHTSGTVPMNLLNSPSSHSIPGLPHNPAPLPMTYQNPTRQQDLRRQVLERGTYNQGESSRGPQDVGYGAQPRSSYRQAPQNPGPGPSGSQAAKTYPLGSMSNPVIHEGPKASTERQSEMRKKSREERRANGICTHAECRNPAAPERTTCEEHLEANRQRGGALRARKRAEGKCYRTGCNEPAVAPGEKCQKCRDAAHARYEARK